MDENGMITPFETVVESLKEDLITTETGVGLGNGTFTCELAGHVFCVWMISELKNADKLFSWMRKILSGVFFTEERIRAVSSNLESTIKEDTRDGSVICEALGLLVCGMPRDFKAISDLSISMWTQKPFLESVSYALNQDGSFDAFENIEDNLENVKKFLISPTTPVFVQFSIPLPSASASTSEPSLSFDPLPGFLSQWRQIFEKKEVVDTPKSKKNTKTKSTRTPIPSPSPSISPAPAAALVPGRKAPHFSFEMPDISQSSKKSIIVPVAGSESAYVDQYIDCSVSKKDEDFYPVLMFCELVSRSEGPLYNKIRGAGLAYDASLTFMMFSQVIRLSLYECSNPSVSLKEFYSLLVDFPKEIDFYASRDAMESAKSSLIYCFHSARATASNAASESLRALFKGFSNYSDEFALLEKLHSVQQSDILRVYNKYFVGFLCDPKERTIVCTVDKNSMTKELDAFAEMGIKMVPTTLKELFVKGNYCKLASAKKKNKKEKVLGHNKK
eukprot:TRINITY_DN6462_c0_g1_i1.p1 TRINITY_DN6462_c0_g1~~TRINITY_DN6462_c0_g1_i1.p1  ORF type:complete len:511 (-),score=164.62 TRINITY_DN6462_c0_g1_i1:59-1567(-)